MKLNIQYIGHISSYTPSMDDWHPKRYINEIKYSEQILIEKNKLFDNDNHLVNKVIELALLFTKLSFKELLNLENNTNNKYAGILAYYLLKYHDYSVEKFVYNYGLPKSTYGHVKTFKRNVLKYEYKSLYYHLVTNYEKIR